MAKKIPVLRRKLELATARLLEEYGELWRPKNPAHATYELLLRARVAFSTGGSKKAAALYADVVAGPHGAVVVTPRNVSITKKMVLTAIARHERTYGPSKKLPRPSPAFACWFLLATALNCLERGEKDGLREIARIDAQRCYDHAILAVSK